MAKKPLEEARNSLKKAFGIFAIIGVLIIFMYLAADAQGYSQWLLILPMGGYILYGNQISKKYQYMPDFADSVYYLGFSFTLLSLFGATVLERLKAEPEEIVSYFGMALSTTILGILYRTYHSQFTDINQDPIEKAREELDKELANFKYELNDLFQRTKDSLTILERDIPEKLSKSLLKIEEKLVYSFLQLEEDLNQISGNYSKINTNISNTYTSLNSNVEKSSKNISENFNDISSNMNVRSQEINKAIDQIKQQVDAFKSQTQSYANEITGNGEITGAYGKLTNSLKAYLDGMEGLTSEVQETSSGFNDTLSSLKKTAKTINDQTKQIEKIFADANKVLENRLS